MFIGQVRRRFREWFAGVRSTSALRKRPSGRSHWASPRALRVEPLEERELLSVTAGAQTWKDFAFASTGVVTGKLTMPYDAGPPYGTINLPVSVYHDARYEGAAFNGTIDYSTSPNQGPNQGTIKPDDSSITGQDAWKVNVPAYYNPPAPGTWVLEGGSVISIADAGGNLTGTVDLTTENETTKYFKALFAGESSGGYDLGGVYDVAGSFSTSNFSINATFSINKPELWGSFTYKGTMTPTDTTPFDVRLRQPLAWGQGNSVTFDVDLSGPVHTAKTETTPITTIQVFWAKGTNLSDILQKNPLTIDPTNASGYKTGIPLYWNQGSGHYTISNFLPAKIPSNATNLLFVVNVNGQSKVLGNLPLPTLSVADTTVDEPAVGAAAANAQFTITLTTPPGFTQVYPVTVAWKTAPSSRGTATPGLDYTTTAKSVTFAQGETTKTIRVPVKGDNVYDPNETFNVTLSNSANAGIADGVGVCTIGDPYPPVVSINDPKTLKEPNLGKTATDKFTVSLLNPATGLAYTTMVPVTVHYATRDGSALAGTDYVSVSDTLLTIPARKSSATLSITVKGDSTAETSLETFYVDLSNALAGSTALTISKPTGTGTIRDPAVPAVKAAALAAYFDQLGQKKDNEAVDLAPAIV